MEREATFATIWSPAIGTPFALINPFDLMKAGQTEEIGRPLEFSFTVKTIGRIKEVDKISANRT